MEINEKQEALTEREIPKHGLGLFIVLALMGLTFWFFDVKEVQVLVERTGIWGPIIFICAKILTIVVAPISGSAIYPMAGAIFGFWDGFLYIFIGDALGSTIAFYISRIFGKSVAERFIGKNDKGYLAQILDYLDSWRGLIEARIFFAALPEAVAYAAGLSKLPFWKFFIVQTGLSIFPIAILVQFGSILNISTNPLIIAGVLAASLIVMFVGGALFTLQVRRRRNHDILNGDSDSTQP